MNPFKPRKYVVFLRSTKPHEFEVFANDAHITKEGVLIFTTWWLRTVAAFDSGTWIYFGETSNKKCEI